ncbi:Inositol-3-phosphate synthase 1-B [Frankliniella fusca]|uniref:Inositol-3-phosphate synthase n=1 Tax=Frankliniella fusca TaxID=407009 RepID=A0AAE1H9S4_9NEOP|nr:Inositol-3-phosphate synthase 1-B [Frankliniella fusca]
MVVKLNQILGKPKKKLGRPGEPKGKPRKTIKPTVTPRRRWLEVRTARRPHRTGVMLVGWGGNNGTTLTAALLANRAGLRWETKEGERRADWLGSLTQSSTLRLGQDADGRDVWVPLADVVPLLRPDDLEVDGWDISGLDLAAAARRNRVLDVEVQRALEPELRRLRPRAAAFDCGFVAANQQERADHVLGGTRAQQVRQLREDIRDFKQGKSLDQVVVLWTANTERFADLRPGLNDTADNLLAAIERDESEVASSTLYAVAAILEGTLLDDFVNYFRYVQCTFINGSPQNTLVPGCLELAERHGTHVVGDDLKTGQTKLKSVLVDFLVGAGIKPTSIVSYNHLGNNDGKNLSAPHTFRSKEVGNPQHGLRILAVVSPSVVSAHVPDPLPLLAPAQITKRNVVDDVVESNSILYGPGERPDHVVVIKYVPYVGDSKRAMDEYSAEILFGGRQTFVVHNTCEDSLLAAPLLLDLVVLAEFCTRVGFRDAAAGPAEEYVPFHSVLALLSYLVKAPMVPRGPVVNSLFRQRTCIENMLRACVGLGPDSNMQLEHKLARPIV